MGTRSNSPAFQFYAADYLADINVQLMSLEEEGAYIRLMSYCWREGGIPNDDAELSRLCKGASAEVISNVKRCFRLSAIATDKLIHPRLDFERKKQKKFAQQKSKAGVESGKSRRRKRLSAEHMFDPVHGSVRTNDERNRTLQSSSSSSSSDYKNTRSNSSVEGETDEWFSRFWSEYWKRVGKGAAIKAFRSAVQTQERFDLVMVAIRKQSPKMLQREPNYRPLAATWLNRKQWEDEEDPPVAEPDPPCGPQYEEFIPEWRRKDKA